MGNFGVMLDACVLIPACLRDTLLWSAHSGLYQAHWSRDILEEVRRNLIDHGMSTPTKVRSLMATLKRSFEEAMVDGYDTLIDTMSVNEKDRHVAAAAVVSHCQVIVTKNTRHFPNRELQRFSIEAQSPDEFLSHLFDLSPDLMVRIVHKQSSNLRDPPISVGQILAALEKEHAPRFVQAVREYMAKTLILDIPDPAVNRSRQET